MFSLTSLKAIKIQNCPGNCQLVFFTIGPFTLRVKKDVFEQMSDKINEFLAKEDQSKVITQKRKLSLVEQ